MNFYDKEIFSIKYINFDYIFVFKTVNCYCLSIKLNTIKKKIGNNKIKLLY